MMGGDMMGGGSGFGLAGILLNLLLLVGLVAVICLGRDNDPPHPANAGPTPGGAGNGLGGGDIKGAVRAWRDRRRGVRAVPGDVAQETKGENLRRSRAGSHEAEPRRGEHARATSSRMSRMANTL
jgi:hypothetical protein